nr:MAG: replication associated protein [Cressdnaviricota sp.]
MVVSETVIRWCFTLNNYTEEQYNHMMNMTGFNHMGYLNGYAQFVICGREWSASGTPHLQGYVQIRSNNIRETFRGMTRAFPGIHLEKTKNVIGSIKYCMKDKNYLWNGDRMLIPEAHYIIRQSHRLHNWEMANDMQEVFNRAQWRRIIDEIECRPETGIVYQQLYDLLS